MAVNKDVILFLTYRKCCYVTTVIKAKYDKMISLASTKPLQRPCRITLHFMEESTGSQKGWVTYPGQTAGSRARIEGQSESMSSETRLHVWAASCQACSLTPPQGQTLRSSWPPRKGGNIAFHLKDNSIERFQKLVSFQGVTLLHVVVWCWKIKLDLCMG